MKSSKFSDVVASVNYEFAKRCTLSEPIIARLADDLIARYSPKQHPHPDFFKEDAALALNQLTLYIDQFIQVMRNYQFLQKAATIISVLTTSCLRINDFLAKQLYHYMKSSGPETPKRSTVSQFLCPACGKLRQNEKIRVMRDELHMPRVEWNAGKIVREVVGRNGQKYDVEELIYQEMQNLDSLNQEQMRKRLQSLQFDHDRRKQEMMVCLEQLKRANDRVAGYSKTIDKKSKDWEGKFNVKEYVFQLSRHFYHNLSNLDHKIKQLKQNLNPIKDVQTQTEEACVLISEHNNAIELLNQSIFGLKVTLNDTKTMLCLEQNKMKENQQTIKYLQQKLGANELEREKDKLQSTLTEKQLNAQLVSDEIKIGSLKNLVKKLKYITKVRNLGLSQDEDDFSLVKTETVAMQFPQTKAEDQNREIQNEFKEKYYSKTFKDNRLEWRETLLLNPNSIMTTDSLDLKNIERGRESQIIGKSSTPVIKKKVNLMKEDRKTRFTLVSTINQTIYPESNVSSKSLHFKIIQCHSRSIEGSAKDIISIKDRVVDPFEQQRPKKARLTKLQSHKRPLDKKITTINSKKSVLILQNQKFSQYGKQSAQDENQNLWIQSLKPRDELQKKSLFETNMMKNQFWDSRKHSKYQGAFEGRENVVFRPKKKRNFSQDHNLQDKDNYDFRRSADRNVWNQKMIFSELNNALQVHKSPSEFQKKPLDKKSLPFRGDYLKTALSLEEINFSTYVYSLTANLHLKNPSTYFYLKKYFCLLSGYNCEDESSIKNSLKIILITHRKCSGNGSICGHLQNLLQKIKSM